MAKNKSKTENLTLEETKAIKEAVRIAGGADELEKLIECIEIAGIDTVYAVGDETPEIKEAERLAGGAHELLTLIECIEIAGGVDAICAVFSEYHDLQKIFGSEA